MIEEAEVVALYRCLLGRAPESDDTIAAFRAYYPDFAAGRQAILGSAEFARLFAGETGGSPAVMAGAMLRTASSVPPMAAAGAVAARMRDVLRRHGAVRLAVVAGQLPVPLEVLLPLEDGAACVVHASRHFGDGVPGLRGFAGARALLCAGRGPAELAELVRDTGLRVDVLAVADDAAWFEAFRPLMAERAILVSGVDFPEAVDGWDGVERVLELDALKLRFAGGWFLPVHYSPEPASELATDAQKLAVAAIVRNEREAIVNMLASVAAVAACFVIVDTGSTDDTVARAEAFLRGTGKPYRIRSLAADRFDVMRNAALDLVPDGMEWVLMLDADEELAPEDHAKLMRVTRDAACDAIALPRYNYLVPEMAGEVAPYPDRQVRLLRRHAASPVRYSGAVHETVRDVAVHRLPLNACDLGQGSGGPHIHHRVRKYRSPAAEAEKQAQYQAIAARYAAG